MERKVLLILFDGMRPDSIETCGDRGFLKKLFQSGSYSLEGKTVFPPITLPVHMSLFYSVQPDVHGTLDNIHVPLKKELTGLVEHLTESGKTFAFFYTWEELRDICIPGNHLSFSWYMGQHVFPFPELERRETEAAIIHIREYEPDIVFLYLGGADEAGHLNGWMSEEYLQAVRDESSCVERILKDLPESYSVIITADHGGHEYTHGDMIPEDMNIPIALIGSDFPAGKRIKEAGILDLAPTISELLGIDPCDTWEGKSLIHVEAV